MHDRRAAFLQEPISNDSVPIELDVWIGEEGIRGSIYCRQADHLIVKSDNINIFCTSNVPYGHVNTPDNSR